MTDAERHLIYSQRRLSPGCGSTKAACFGLRGGQGVEVAAGEACTADLQGLQAWVRVCNLDFTAMQMLPPRLETVFCDTESLHTAQRRIVAAPNGIRLADGGLRIADLLQTFGEHGLLVTRWTEPVGGDVAIEVDVSTVGNRWPPAAASSMT